MIITGASWNDAIATAGGQEAGRRIRIVTNISRVDRNADGSLNIDVPVYAGRLVRQAGAGDGSAFLTMSSDAELPAQAPGDTFTAMETDSEAGPDWTAPLPPPAPPTLSNAEVIIDLGYGVKDGSGIALANELKKMLEGMGLSPMFGATRKVTQDLKLLRSITGVLIPISMLPIFGFTTLIFGIPTGMLVLAVMIALFGLFYLYVFLRTWNAYLLVISAECAFLVAMLTIVYVNITQTGLNYASNPFESREYALAYFSGLFFFDVVLIFLTLTRRLKWRGREVFELAAETIEETGNGYTSRPRPVGKVDYSLQQLSNFAQFCSRHLIALPYNTSKNITLVPIKMGDEFGRLLGLSGSGSC